MLNLLRYLLSRELDSRCAEGSAGDSLHAPAPPPAQVTVGGSMVAAQARLHQLAALMRAPELAASVLALFGWALDRRSTREEAGDTRASKRRRTVDGGVAAAASAGLSVELHLRGEHASPVVPSGRVEAAANAPLPRVVCETCGAAAVLHGGGASAASASGSPAHTAARGSGPASGRAALSSSALAAIAAAASAAAEFDDRQLGSALEAQEDTRNPPEAPASASARKFLASGTAQSFHPLREHRWFCPWARPAAPVSPRLALAVHDAAHARARSGSGAAPERRASLPRSVAEGFAAVGSAVFGVAGLDAVGRTLIRSSGGDAGRGAGVGDTEAGEEEWAGDEGGGGAPLPGWLLAALALWASADY